MPRPFDEKRLTEIGKKIMDAMEEINLVLQYPENLLDVEFSDTPDGTPVFGEVTENEIIFKIRYNNDDEIRDARTEHLDEIEKEVMKTLEEIRKKKGG